MTTARLVQALATQDEKSSCNKKILDFCKQASSWLAYKTHVYLSTLTGIRNISIPHLWGNPILGKLKLNMDDEGVGKIIDQAAQRAAKHPSGMCYFWFVHKYVLLVTKPADIQKLMYDNKNNLYGYDVTGFFKYFFGSTLLNVSEHDPLWHQQRKFLTDRLMTPKTLYNYTKPMTGVIQQHLNTVSNLEINDLNQFVSRLALDFIAKTQLGFADFSFNEMDAMIKMVSESLSIATSPKNLIFSSLENNPDLNEILNKSHQLFASILERNASYIYAEESDNIIKIITKGNPAELTSKKVLYFITFLLIAGYETSSRLLLFSLMLLADEGHRSILETLRQAIQAAGHDDINKIPYLDQVVRAVIGLYPSFPFFKDCVANNFYFGNIPLYAGDSVIIAPWVSRETVQFLPRPGLSEYDKSCRWIPFGFMPRTCPGRNFSMLEAKLLLKEFVMHFNMKINAHHPYELKKMFSLQLKHRVTLKLTPTAQIKHDSEKKVPHIKLS